MWRKSSSNRMSKSGVVKIRRDGYNTVNGFSQKNAWWDLRDFVFKRDKGMCVSCAQQGRRVPGKEVHHIVPLSRGGTNTPSNLVTLCLSCHERRHAGNKHLASYHKGK